MRPLPNLTPPERLASRRALLAAAGLALTLPKMASAAPLRRLRLLRLRLLRHPRPRPLRPWRRLR
jgi:hypothetical protein